MKSLENGVFFIDEGYQGECILVILYYDIFFEFLLRVEFKEIVLQYLRFGQLIFMICS